MSQSFTVGACCLLIALGAGPSAWAGGGVVWDPTGGVGDLAEATDWAGGVLPGPTDSVLFDTPGGATTAGLSLPTFSVTGISIASGDTTFDLDGGTFIGNTASVGVGGSAAELLLLDGTLDITTLTLGDGAGSDVGLTLGAGGEVTASGTVSAMSDAAVTIDGGSLTAHGLSFANPIDFQSGSLTVTDDLDWADLGSPASLTIGASHSLTVEERFTFDAGETLTLDGGSLSIQLFAGTGSLDYVSGTLFTGTGVYIGTGGDMASDVVMNSGDVWQNEVSGVRLTSGFSFTLQGGSFMTDDLQVDVGGAFAMSSGALEVTGNFVVNGATVLSGGTATVGRFSGDLQQLSITGPTTVRLTRELLSIRPGGEWGDSFTLASGVTFQAEDGLEVGTSGAATLTLDAGSVMRTDLLFVGADAMISVDPTAQFRADTVFVEDALALEDYGQWGIEAWTADIVTIDNRGELTYDGPGELVIAANVIGNGSVRARSGELVLDRTADAEAITTTHNTFVIDQGAGLTFRGAVDTFPGVFDDQLVISSNEAVGIQNGGVLRLDRVQLVLNKPYTGGGAVELLPHAQLILGTSSMTVQDLTAHEDTSISGIEPSELAELTIFRSDSVVSSIGPSINVTFIEEAVVSSRGAFILGDLTNLGVLRLEEDAELKARLSTGRVTTTHLNAPGASILMGDGSSYEPLGTFQNFGTVALEGAGTGLVRTSLLIGNGVFDAGQGNLEVEVFDASQWNGRLIGQAGSSLTLVNSSFSLVIASDGAIDTAGDFTLSSGGGTPVVAAPITVGGLLTLGASTVEIADLATAVNINDLALAHGTTLRITSGQTIDIGSLSVLDDIASNPGAATIETVGAFNIGAGGITTGRSVTFRGGGVYTIDGAVSGSTGLWVDGSTLRYASTMTQMWGDEIVLDNAAVFELLPTGSIIGLDFDGDGGTFINRGQVITDTGPDRDWDSHRTENFGEIRVVSGSGLEIGRQGGDIINHGLLEVEAGGTLNLYELSQTATGVLRSHGGTVRINPGDPGFTQIQGRVDLAGSQVRLSGDVFILPGADIISLGNVEISTTTRLVGTTGQDLIVGDLEIGTSLMTDNATNTDALFVTGTLSGGNNQRIHLPAIVSGTVAPGQIGGANHVRLRFRNGLTLKTGAALELDFRNEFATDDIEVAFGMEIEPGVTLRLESPLVTDDPYEVGLVIRLIEANTPIVGTFDTVTGLDHGNGSQWHLSYDATGLLAEVRHAGDIDGDGFVGAADLDVLLAQWGDSIAAGTGADLTGDGLIGQGDLDVVQAYWGAGTPSGPDVPEPGTLAMLGVLGLLHRRRR